MKPYHKINGIYKRDRKTNRLIIGDYSVAEFKFLKNTLWQFTEKVDGTNIRIFWVKEKISYGGRTNNAEIPVFLQNKLDEIFQNDKMIGLFKDQFSDQEVCIYGEGYGLKIQKLGGNYNPKGVDFVAFDIKIGHWWLKREDVKAICADLGLNIVPIMGFGTIDKGISLVTDGLKSAWGDFIAEGLIVKPKLDLIDRAGRRIITKIKHKDFTKEQT